MPWVYVWTVGAPVKLRHFEIYDDIQAWFNDPVCCYSYFSKFSIGGVKTDVEKAVFEDLENSANWQYVKAVTDQGEFYSWFNYTDMRDRMQVDEFDELFVKWGFEEPSILQMYADGLVLLAQEVAEKHGFETIEYDNWVLIYDPENEVFDSLLEA